MKQKLSRFFINLAARAVDLWKDAHTCALWYASIPEPSWLSFPLIERYQGSPKSPSPRRRRYVIS
jgi:hypothetical protein